MENENSTETNLQPVDGVAVPAVVESSVDGAPAVVVDPANPAPVEPVIEPPKENHEARRLKKFMDKAAQLEAENLALKKQFGTVTNPAPVKIEAPKRESFESDADFIQARIDFGIQQAIPQVEGRIKQSSQRAAAETTFQKRVEELKAVTPDYEETIEDAVSIIVPEIVAMEIGKSEYGPDLTYHFCKHPEDAQRLMQINDPARLLREMGRIEARIEAEIAAKKTGAPAPKVAPKVSGAPAPIKPLKSDGVIVETDIDKVPIDEFFKRRNEQRKKLGKQY
jgi:hypothetical protein